MDSSIRASAFAGAGAFALSIIVALFSRVPFGALILRALLSGLAFAGLTYGAILLLRRFLPELFDEQRPEAAVSPSGIGGLVDIVLPGGEAHEALSELPGVGEAEAASRGVDGAANVAASGKRDPLVAMAQGEAAFVASSPVGGAAFEAGDIEREVQDLRSGSFETEDSGPASPAGAPRPSVALDELDALPDLDGFSDSFASQAGSDSGDMSQSIGPAESMPSASSPGGQDPAALAKAVQTLMRRDQKGQS